MTKRMQGKIDGVIQQVLGETGAVIDIFGGASGLGISALHNEVCKAVDEGEDIETAARRVIPKYDTRNNGGRQ